MKRTAIVFALAVFSFLALRLIHLEADAPRVPNGQHGLELVVEAPAKAYEARKLALFGELSTSDADEYRFWSVQAPAYVFPLAGFMSVAGVGYAQLRVYGVLVGLLGFVLVLWLLRGRIGVVPFALVGVLASVHFYYLHYLRAGLLEPELNTWLIATVFVALLARNDSRFLFAVPIAWTLAFLTKQTALAFLPLAALGMALALRAQRGSLSKSQLFALAGVVVACAAGLLLLVTDDAYVRTVEWNYQHMFHARESFDGPEASLGRVIAAASGRLLNFEHWKQGVLLVIPICFPFALAHTARSALALVRRQPVSALSLLSITWFLLGLAALFSIEHARGRFSHILLPPAFLLFGLELDFWLSRWNRTWVTTLASVGIVAAVLSTHARWSFDWLVHPEHQVRDANRTLSGFLDQDDVVVGFRAPLLAFDSAADVFYVKRHFNDAPERLSKFGATHLLLSRKEVTTRIVARDFPKSFASKKELAVVELFRRPHALYELRDPLQ